MRSCRWKCTATVAGFLVALGLAFGAGPSFAVDVEENDFEIGINEDSNEDYDRVETQGQNETLEPRANIRICSEVDAGGGFCDELTNETIGVDPERLSANPGAGPDWAQFFEGKLGGICETTRTAQGGYVFCQDNAALCTDPGDTCLSLGTNPEALFGIVTERDDVLPAGPDCEEFPGAIDCVFMADFLTPANAEDPTTLISGGSEDNTKPVQISFCSISGASCIVDADCPVAGDVCQTVDGYDWGDGNTPPKDDISNAYVYFRFEAGHLIMYAGLERLAPNGSAHMDLEVNQGKIGLDRPIPCPSGEDCFWTGVRQDNDALISFDYDQGGRFGSLEGRKWEQQNTCNVTGAACNVLADCGVTDTACLNIGDGQWSAKLFELNAEGCNPAIAGPPAIAANSVCGFNNNAGFLDNAEGLGQCVAAADMDTAGDNFSSGALCDSDVDCVIAGETCQKSADLKNNDPAGILPGDWPTWSGDGTNPLEPFGDFGNLRIPPNGFTEIGVDLSDVLGVTPCVTSIQFKTRSSGAQDDPTTAQLKDFVQGEAEVCGLEVVKDGDGLTKIGDDLEYTITITNTGGIRLWKKSIIDVGVLWPGLGDLTDGTNPLIDTSDCGDFLDPDLSCTITLSGIVGTDILPGDNDPFINEVTAIYNNQQDLMGTDVTDLDDHSVNPVTVAIDVDKTGDTLSKIGDDVDYTITLSNNSSDDAPALTCTATDDLLGVVFGPAVLPLGDTVLNETRKTLESDVAPVVNMVDLECTVATLGNVLEADDDHSFDIFTPAIDVDKTGDTLSKVGDVVDYTITLSNNSSANTPALTCTATDDLLGVVFGPAVLPLGDTVLNETRTTLESDVAPVVNTVDLDCTVGDGFGNVLNAEDNHSFDIFVPSFSVAKVCDDPDDLIDAGANAPFKITITNTSTGPAGTPDLMLAAILDTHDDPDGNALAPMDISGAATAAGCDVLSFPGEVCTIDLSFPTNPATAVGFDFNNFVQVTYTVPGFGNVLGPLDASAVCRVEPPAPGVIITEKVELGAAGFPGGMFDLVTTEGCLANPDCNFDDHTLAPTVGAATNGCSFPDGVDSPFNGVPNPAGDGFDCLRQENVVSQVDANGDPVPVQYTVTEPVSEDGDNGTTFVSVECRETVSQAPFGSVLDRTATLMIEPGDNITCRFINQHPDEGCTPGFWQGGAGQQFWDEENDPTWADQCFGVQPWTTTTVFNDFLSSNGLPTCDLAGLTTLDIVASGGTDDDCRKAARDFIAALNNIRCGMQFGGNEGTMFTDWTDAVNAGANGSPEQDAALLAFHIKYGGFNDPTPDDDCPLPR